MTFINKHYQNILIEQRNEKKAPFYEFFKVFILKISIVTRCSDTKRLFSTTTVSLFYIRTSGTIIKWQSKAF